MFLKKKDFPEEDELVLCTVTNTFHHGVFVNVDEYAKSGMIHISEVSPGRIRNIRDFVKEGKKIVCKVLRIDLEKGHIDLSLRRVNERQKKEKINEIKQEQKAEKIVEFAAKKLGKDPKKFYDELVSKIFDKYDLLNLCFGDIVKGEVSLEKLGVDKKVSDLLTEFVHERMKLTEVFVGGEFRLKSYSPNGVEIIKGALSKAFDGDKVIMLYKGAGKYKIKVTANKYKDAEGILEKSIGNVLDFIEKEGGEGKFIKAE